MYFNEEAMFISTSSPSNISSNIHVTSSRRIATVQQQRFTQLSTVFSRESELREEWQQYYTGERFWRTMRGMRWTAAGKYPEKGCNIPPSVSLKTSSPSTPAHHTLQLLYHPVSNPTTPLRLPPYYFLIPASASNLPHDPLNSTLVLIKILRQDVLCCLHYVALWIAKRCSFVF